MQNWLSKSGVVAFLSTLVVLAGLNTARADCGEVPPTRHGEVYLLRGLANIFSLGLDRMGKEFSANGMKNCVYNHSRWQELADDIIARGQTKQIDFPIIIIGHSLGADAAPMMATRIGNAGIPVAYVVMLDPVIPTKVGKNVKEIVNWYIQKKDKDKILSPLPDFKGKLVNLDVTQYGVDHFDIDKNPLAHKTIIEHALELSDKQAAPTKTKSKKK